MAKHFETVQAHGGEGDDVAELNRLAAEDTLTGQGDSARVTGSRKTLAKNFSRVRAQSSENAKSVIDNVDFLYEQFGSWNS